MPSADYHRKQAQIFAGLAIGSIKPSEVKTYNMLALEHLARAEELESLIGAVQPERYFWDCGSNASSALRR
jgi:hypothetical protein